MSNWKAPGPDKIQAGALKIGGNNLLSFLKRLFRKILSEKQIPEQMKQSILILIHKKGDRMNAQNYRPISLLQVQFKLLDAWLFSVVDKYIKIAGDYFES